MIFENNYDNLNFSVGGMNRPSKAVTQVKKVAPPAVPDVFRHSGSSFGSAGYASSEDGCFLSSGTGSGGAGDDGSYGMPSGKSPGPIFTHPGFAFPPIVGKYAHAEDQGTCILYVHDTHAVTVRNSHVVNNNFATIYIYKCKKLVFSLGLRTTWSFLFLTYIKPAVTEINPFIIWLQHHVIFCSKSQKINYTRSNL